MEIREIISKNICGLRKKAMLTQVELADKLNYSDKAISKWERGESLPDAEMLYKIAELFDVDISYLFEEHDFETLSEQDMKKLHTKATVMKILVAFTLVLIPFIIFSLILSGLSEVIEIGNFPLGISLIIFGSIITFIFFVNLFYKYNKYLMFLSSASLWLYLLGFYFLFSSHNLFMFFAIAIGLQLAIIFFPKIKHYIDYEVTESSKRNNIENNHNEKNK